MFDGDKKNIFDIDLTELEKIKNAKSDKKEFEKEGYDLSSLEEVIHEYVEDEYFIHNIDEQIKSFNSSLSAKERKDVKSILKVHRKNQKAIFLHHKKINTMPLQPFVETKSNEPHENISEIIEGFKNEINVQKPSRTTFVTRRKKHNIIDKSLLTSNIENLLTLNAKCIWLNHADTRFKERTSEELNLELRNDIEKYLINVFQNNRLNFDQEYELHYRTENVHTFKIVCFKTGKYIFIKTLYRIDKDSKQEYLKNKNQYKRKS